MADNGDELLIVDGVAGYVFNLITNTFQSVTDPDFPVNATHVTFQDGYLIAAQADSSNWRLSGINNAAAWDPLDRQSIQTKADQIVAVQPEPEPQD